MNTLPKTIYQFILVLPLRYLSTDLMEYPLRIHTERRRAGSVHIGNASRGNLDLP